MVSEDARRALNDTCIEMLVSIGLIASVMGRYPLEVQSNFTDKIYELGTYLEKVTEEFVSFGEAYDDHVEGE